MSDDVKARRRARYQRREATNAARSAPRTRPSDIAPRRATDGLKPDHAKRIADLDACWPHLRRGLATAPEPTRAAKEENADVS